jgi:integrase
MHIEKRGNSLLIRFSHDGKPYSFSLPKHNNPVGMSAAKMKMAQIEKDINYGNFDTTLLRYKPRKLGNDPTAISAVELFEKYIPHHQQERGLTHGSGLRLKAILSKLDRLLGDKPAEKVTEPVAKDLVTKWLESASSKTVKSYLYYLKACWDWAEGKYHVAESNPWECCLTTAITRGHKAPNRQQKKPFTIAELQAIISAFATDSYYSHYTDFIIFLASTACRFGEVAGLRWQHLGSDYSTVWIGESISRGHQNHKGTKTGKHRTIQLPPNVRAMLVARFNRLSPQPDELVFPSPKGLPINDHTFRRRAWKTIIESCHIEYRSPYNLRHTAISHALHNGANYIALAEQTGHDKRMMLSTYAHAIGSECLFVDIETSHLQPPI